MHPTRIEQIGNLRNRRDSPRGRMSWEDHESKRMEPAGSGATWTGSPEGVFAGRKHHKPGLALNNNTAGRGEEGEVGERDDELLSEHARRGGREAERPTQRRRPR